MNKEEIAELIRDAATQAHLHLSEEEHKELCEKFSSSMSLYIQDLASIDITDLPQADIPTAIWREDLVEPSLPKAEALQNAPRQDGDFFVVPKVK